MKISNEVDHFDEMPAETSRSMELTDTLRSTASLAWCAHAIVSADGKSEVDLEAHLLCLASCSAPLPPKAGARS